MPQGYQVDVTATVSGSSAPVVWSGSSSLGGAVMLDQLAARSAVFTAPFDQRLPSVVTVTGTVEGVSGSCTIQVFILDVAGSDQVIVGEAPQRLTATVQGLSDPIVWSLTGPGSLINSTARTVDYLAPLDEAQVGQIVRIGVSIAGYSVSYAWPLSARRSRGLSLFTWGRVPLITTNGMNLVADAFVANGPGSVVRATRTALGTYTMQVDGMALGGSGGVALHVTPIASTASCRVESFMLDTFEVRCITPTGLATDSAFSFRVAQSDVTSTGRVVAFGFAGSSLPIVGSQPLVRFYAARGAPDVTNPSTGHYLLSFPSTTAIGDVQVTATVDVNLVSAARCNVLQISGTDVFVRCTDAAGAAVNNPFSISVTGVGVVTRAVVETLAVVDGPVPPNVITPVPRFASAARDVVTVRRFSTGRYTIVRTLNSSSAVTRAEHAVRLEGDGSCAISVRGPAFTDVVCFDAAGQLSDAKFLFMGLAEGAPTDAAITGYALITTPGASQTPTGANVYNTTGQSVVSTRTGPGAYSVAFTGLSLANSNAQVTALTPLAGNALPRCGTAGFANDAVQVRCFDGTGAPLDAMFFVTVSSWFTPSAARLVAYARVTSQGTLGPSTFVSNPSGATSSARASPGTYSVTFTGLTSQDVRNVQVQAMNSNRVCTVSGFVAPTIQVRCTDGVGVADSDFSVAIATAQPTSVFGMQALTRSEVLGFSWLDQPSTASYSPFAPLTYNSGGQAVVASRSAPGVYAVSFPGLWLSSGLVQATTTVPELHCVVMSAASSTANVRCYNVAGLLTDATYLISIQR